MPISATTSMDSSLAMMASNMKNENVQQQVSVSVLKQVQNTQDIQAQALIKMMNDTGSIIDRSA